MNREEAKAAGEKFFDGVPCRKGGHTKRYTASGCCVVCHKAYREAHKEKHKEYMAKWIDDNREENNAYHREYYSANDGYREKKLKYRSRYIRENNAKVNSHTSKRRASLLNATPSWFDREKEDVEAVYEHAKYLTEETGIVHHVDHIVPLVNDQVCGLHTLANLRAIPAQDNLSKSNRFEEQT